MEYLLGAGIFLFGLFLGWVITKTVLNKGKITQSMYDEAINNVAVYRTKFEQIESDKTRLEDKLDAVNSEMQSFKEKSIILETEKTNLEQRIKEHKKDIEEIQEKTKLEFENLANKIFEEKSSRFKTQSKESINELLNPLKEKITEFNKMVTEKFNDQSKEQIVLKKEIESIIKVNEKMSLQTENLTKALKGDVKAQGNWGEVILEKILEESGLRKDEDYIVQASGLGLKHVESGGYRKVGYT